MRALSIRQPFAELILRGIKTVEYRSRPTSIIGQRFYIYASKGRGMRAEGGNGYVEAAGGGVWSNDVEAARVPGWMIELARQVKMIEADAVLPVGVIVGSAVIERVGLPDPADAERGLYRWELADVKRLSTPRKPKGHPQPVWWRPF